MFNIKSSLVSLNYPVLTISIVYRDFMNKIHDNIVRIIHLTNLLLLIYYAHVTLHIIAKYSTTF